MGMTRLEFLLAILAPAEGDPLRATFIPKVAFIVDQEMPELGGPHFAYVRGDFGPRFEELHPCLEELVKHKWAVVYEPGDYRLKWVVLTWRGQEYAKRILEGLDPRSRDYVTRVGCWAYALDFRTLTAALHSRYPDMTSRLVQYDTPCDGSCEIGTRYSALLDEG